MVVGLMLVIEEISMIDRGYLEWMVKLSDIDEKLLLCVLDPYDKYEYVATRIAFSLSSRQI